MAHPKGARLVSEFVGTFILVLTVGCNVLSGNTVGFAVLSIASSLMVSIYALGGVSGGHFNPVVTLAITLAKKNSEGWVDAIHYMLVQLLAGVAAGFSYGALYNDSFNLAPGKGYTWLHAGVIEVLYTMMLCLTVLLAACDRKSAGNQYYGLAIGFVIVAGGIAGGPISGGAFNPAVALGVDIVSFRHGFGWSIAYWGFELIGAAVATILFSLVRPSEVPEKSGENDPASTVSKLLAEFLGTFFLVVTVGLCVGQSVGGAALSIASALMVSIYAFGHVSGAHLNPAVTVAVLLSGRGKTDAADASRYIAVQLFAGVVGSAVAASLVATKPFHPHDVGLFRASAVEVVYTFVLAYVVLTVATVRAPSKDMFGLVIGFCVIVGGFAIGSLSGGSLNPAVIFGVDLTRSIEYGEAHHLGSAAAYIVAELIGGILAVVLFKITHHTEFDSKKVDRAPLNYGSA